MTPSDLWQALRLALARARAAEILAAHCNDDTAEDHERDEDEATDEVMSLLASLADAGEIARAEQTARREAA
ncbi:hypothetical protein [Defluviimonas sp. SAOS-178_SWC]|uniref:hypothetical protein n=1 Tax=Defluviimonas sp. SAOS-178_SWC TaxID=3121287 RepID=UPI003221619C